MFSPTVQKLIDELSKLPGIGPKTAQRLTFHLLKLSPEEALPLAQALVDVKETVHFCADLLQPHRAGAVPDLPGLRDETRSIICVVEEPGDVVSIERTHEYRGLYHVLGGALSPLDGIGPQKLHLAELFERARSGEVREVIVATNPNMAGEATALYIAEELKDLTSARHPPHHPARPPGCPWAETSSTPTRSPSAARSPDGGSSRNPLEFSASVGPLQWSADPGGGERPTQQSGLPATRGRAGLAVRRHRRTAAKGRAHQHRGDEVRRYVGG